MQQQNYLKQDEKVPGRESFVTYVDFQVQDGSADMWLYDIFPGVQLMVANFAMPHSSALQMKQSFGVNVSETYFSLYQWSKPTTTLKPCIF